MSEQQEIFEAINDKPVDIAYTGREIVIREIVRADGAKAFQMGNTDFKNLFELYGILAWATSAVGRALQSSMVVDEDED